MHLYNLLEFSVVLIFQCVNKRVLLLLLLLLIKQLPNGLQNGSVEKQFKNKYSPLSFSVAVDVVLVLVLLIYQ